MAARFRWWKEPHSKIASTLIPTVRALDRELNLEEKYRNWINQLQNRSYSGLTPGKLRGPEQPLYDPRTHKVPGREQLAVNMTQNIQEALLAQVCANPPKPRFLTVAGDYSRRRRAQKTDRGVSGIFHKSEGYEAAEMTYRDCEAVGIAHAKVVEDVIGRDVLMERLVPSEVLWDEDATPNGKPAMRYQRKWVTADSLADRFPRYSAKINKAVGATGDNMPAPKEMVATDLVYVVEGWKLPTYEGGKGRHCLAIDGATLIDEKWTDKVDPIASISWIKPFVGCHGQGLVEYLAPIQQELNAACRLIQAGLQTGGMSRTFYEEGAIDEKQAANIPNSFVKVAQGHLNKIRTDVGPAMAGQTMMWPDWLVRIGHLSSGMNEMTAAGVKPAEVESGVAMRQLADITSLRFAMHFRAYQRLIIAMADRAVRAARRLVEKIERHAERNDEEEAPSYMVQVPGRSGGILFEVDWKETLNDRDTWQVQTWPTNLLPSEPGAKLATVTEMLDKGLINQMIAHALLDFPDLELMQDLYASEIDLVDFQIEKILDGAKANDVKLRSFQTFQVVILRAGQQARQAVLDGAPESVIEQLEKYISNAANRVAQTQQSRELLQQMQQAQQQPQPPAAGGGPMELPAAAPASAGPAS